MQKFMCIDVCINVFMLISLSRKNYFKDYDRTLKYYSSGIRIRYQLLFIPEL